MAPTNQNLIPGGKKKRKRKKKEKKRKKKLGAEICTILGYYEASRGNSIQTFRDRFAA